MTPAWERVDTDCAVSVRGERDHGVDAGHEGDLGHGVHQGEHQPPGARGQVSQRVQQGRGEQVHGVPGQLREAELVIRPLEVQLPGQQDVGAQEVPFRDKSQRIEETN